MPQFSTCFSFFSLSPQILEAQNSLLAHLDQKTPYAVRYLFHGDADLNVTRNVSRALELFAASSSTTEGAWNSMLFLSSALGLPCQREVGEMILEIEVLIE